MISFTICPSKKASPFRRIHGMNLAAPIIHARRCRELSDYLRKLNIPQTRMHDCPLNNPGKMLVDIPCVFPLEHADPFKEENYIFGDTDDYFANALNYGTSIMYRLGTSIDHSGFAHHTAPPADPAKWVEIASHIIDHYNNGWSNGFHYDIKYWEIWNEADTELPILWKGTWKQFIDFYCFAAKALKSRHPELKIGGPSMAKITSLNGSAFPDFLKGCRDQQAPLDFFTYHQYSDKPQKVIAAPAQIRAVLNEYGFSQTEIHLSEWHYHAGWGSQCDIGRQKKLQQEMVGPHSAAYLTAVLSRFQDEPIDMTHYYTGSTGSGYSLFSNFGEPHCGYYAFDFLNRMMETERIEATADHPGVTVLAGKTADGAIRILASCFKTDQDDLAFSLEKDDIRAKHWKLTVVDVDGEKRDLTKDIRVEENRLIFEKASGSMTVFLEFTKP